MRAVLNRNALLKHSGTATIAHDQRHRLRAAKINPVSARQISSSVGRWPGPARGRCLDAGRSKKAYAVLPAYHQAAAPIKEKKRMLYYISNSGNGLAAWKEQKVAKTQNIALTIRFACSSEGVQGRFLSRKYTAWVLGDNRFDKRAARCLHQHLGGDTLR